MVVVSVTLAAVVAVAVAVGVAVAIIEHRLPSVSTLAEQLLQRKTSNNQN